MQRHGRAARGLPARIVRPARPRPLPSPGHRRHGLRHGKKKILIQGEEIFSTASWNTRSRTPVNLFAGHSHRLRGRPQDADAGVLAVARRRGRGPPQGSDRLYLRNNPKFHTGTYFAFKDKIINAYQCKSINKKYDGCDDFDRALSNIWGRSVTGAKVSLVEKENGPLKSWLGFQTWSEWTETASSPWRSRRRPSTTRTASTSCSRAARSSSCASTRWLRSTRWTR